MDWPSADRHYQQVVITTDLRCKYLHPIRQIELWKRSKLGHRLQQVTNLFQVTEYHGGRIIPIYRISETHFRIRRFLFPVVPVVPDSGKSGKSKAENVQYVNENRENHNKLTAVCTKSYRKDTFDFQRIFFMTSSIARKELVDVTVFFSQF